MKLVLTGGTGFIGQEILTQCIAHHYVDHVYVLTRRPLDDRFSHKKVSQILHEDFEIYPEYLLQRFREEGVEACIWALGGPVGAFKDLDEARKVGVNYVAAASEAFEKDIARHLEPYEGFPASHPRPGQRRFPFRFIFISAWGAEQDQFRRLWMYNDSRKIKGAAERAIFSTARNAEERDGHKCFEVISLRPGNVLRGTSDGMGTVLTEAIIPSIVVDRLAKTAIKTAFHGADGKTILENKDCLGDDWADVNSFTF
jgi:hypothetical protein